MYTQSVLYIALTAMSTSTPTRSKINQNSAAEDILILSKAVFFNIVSTNASLLAVKSFPESSDPMILYTNKEFMDSLIDYV
jgi:hypothetical protein